MTKKLKEERKPFIISNNITSEISDTVSAALKGYIADDLKTPTIYDKNTKDVIDLSNPFEYYKRCIDNASRIQQQEKVSSLEAFRLSKDEIDNAYILFNTDHDHSDGLVKIDNFSDTMIMPVLNNVTKLIENGTTNRDANIIIIRVVDAKLYSSFISMITQFIVGYTNDVMRAIAYYINNSNEDITVFSDLVLLNSKDLYLYNNCILELSDLFADIIQNETRNSLRENAEIIWEHADNAINIALIKIYEHSEISVLSNFVDYINKHAAEFDMAVAHDLQLLILDKLHDNVLLMHNDLYQLFNNILTDIDIYWMQLSYVVAK